MLDFHGEYALLTLVVKTWFIRGFGE